MALILCPRCRHLLVQDDPVRQPCRNCHGVYVRREAIAPLFEEIQQARGAVVVLAPYRSAPGEEHALPPPPPPDEKRYLACPYCSKQMNRVTLFAEFRIVVDMCLSHGIWFDAEEIGLAARYAGAKRGTPLEPDGQGDPVETLLGCYFAGSDRVKR
jgi:Zn-finger nucleic acid-binding protein